MAWNLPNPFKNLNYTRDKGGNHNYFNQSDNWTGSKSNNLYIAQNHPILTPALLFRSKLFSQANFEIRDKTTLVVQKKHWLLELIRDPNYYQTKSDFLESLDFIQVAQGKAVLWTKRSAGFNKNEDIDSLYLLNSDLIMFPSGYSSKMVNRRNDKSIEKTEVIYDREGENIPIKLRDLIFFYDLPNMLHQPGGKNTTPTNFANNYQGATQGNNFFSSQSRLDGLKQTLINTQDSLLAKNIILKTNGKELITDAGTGTGAMPLSTAEKAAAEELLQSGYGLGWFRKRGIVTKSKLDWKSLHIALRDLGLDESVKVDGNIIYTALHIPKDILSLEAKKTTYNNYKESMVSYIQNEMQSSVDAFTDVFNCLLKDTNLELVGSYDHLSVMKFILIQKYEGISKRAKALNDLLITGVPQEVALELCGFDKNLELEEIQIITATENPNIDGPETQETE